MTNPGAIRAAAIARGRTIKRNIALTAVLCGFVPVVLLAARLSTTPVSWLLGFLLGLVWANGFEYIYHRYLLHLSGSFFGRPHLQHHMSIGSPAEAEDLHLVGSPGRAVLLFIVNGVPVLAADFFWLGLGIAPGMLVAFVAYLVLAEEIHWRIHLGGWIPPGLSFARTYHLAHHDRPDSRFNIFLPLFDWLLGPWPAE